MGIPLVGGSIGATGFYNCNFGQEVLPSGRWFMERSASEVHWQSVPIGYHGYLGGVSDGFR